MSLSPQSLRHKLNYDYFPADAHSFIRHYVKQNVHKFLQTPRRTRKAQPHIKRHFASMRKRKGMFSTSDAE